MEASVIRQKYLNFFASRDHKIIPSAPLVPENDPSTLFTSSGMQPLVSYLLGLPHPLGKRLVDSQKSFRAQDIEEVSDNRHTTFFEMLGNWSLGNYFKKDQLTWFWEFLTRELDLPEEKLYVSVFEGNAEVPRDEESVTIWKNLGVPESHIFYYGAKKNWWSRSGAPENMPAGEPGGPDSEVFFEFTQVKHDPKFGEKCHPNCDCGRFLEIGNSVFMQYQKQSDGSIKEMAQKNVDFGGGLERLAAATNNDPDVFKTDLFLPIIESICHKTGKNYDENTSAIRIISDHIKASVFLIADGVVPSNKGQGYVLRRLLRRAAIKWHLLQKGAELALESLTDSVIGLYQDTDYFASQNKVKIENEIGSEVLRFSKTLAKGLKEIEKIPQIDGKTAFDLYQTYGFPWESTVELTTQKGLVVNRNEFEAEFKKHQDLSRTASAGMFKGGLSDHSKTVTQYHTATHLLHKALRDVLGAHVHQSGSNITGERLRFDFTHPNKLKDEELKKIESTINEKIHANLSVTHEEMPKTKALSQGALAFFPEKYPEITSVYTIGPLDNWYSKELCGGPHVASTGEIGKIKIFKEESAGQGIRRIYAELAS